MISENIKNTLATADRVDSAIEYLVRNKETENLTWTDISDLINDYFGFSRSRHYYSRNYSYMINKPVSVDDKILELQKERYKINDELTQNRAYIRRLSREDTIKEIAKNAVDNISKKKFLEPIIYDLSESKLREEKEGILCLSDWHYGIEIDNAWNVYNPQIARQRLSQLLKEVIEIGEKENVYAIRVLDLGDLIAGRIHLTIRLESRVDVITQIMDVSEMMCEFLNELANHFEVHYYSCADNHSRLEPNKSDSLALESLVRITYWYVKNRVGDRVHIHSNEFGDDIITFKMYKFNILAVHGDKDKPSQIIDSISRMTHSHYDLICTAHLHHFSADEKNETVICGNGSLMGTDSYAASLRLSSKPSQNLIISTPKNVIQNIYRIVVD